MKKLVLMAVMVIALISCDNKETKTIIGEDGKTYEVIVGREEPQMATSFGNGVYYFDCSGKKFATSLSYFIEKNSELELVSMTGDGNDTYGRDAGYFVVFKKKSPTP